MDRVQAKEIAERFAFGNYTEAEHEAIFQWLLSLPLVTSQSLIDEYSEIFEALPVAPARMELWEKIYQRMDEPTEVEGKELSVKGKLLPHSYSGRKWIAAAAVLILLFGTGSYLLLFNKPEKATVTASISKQDFNNDIAPGKNEAILTLAGGQKIMLDSTASGMISTQGNSSVLNANGQLTYNAPGQSTGDVLYNTLTTGRGNQYQLMLPDGSKVWLNAASSLKFPVSFASQKERLVELKGEAYFEVVHNKMLPFKVITERHVVEDLGTSFNVNAYDDEATTKTTLLQGSIRVVAGDKSALLIPGQQAAINNGIKVAQVKTAEVIAWKNGYFNFDDENLENIMKSVVRWYNVDVVFQDESLKNETFGAVTARFSNISTLLKMMEQTGDARFSIEGSTIRISRKKQVP